MLFYKRFLCLAAAGLFLLMLHLPASANGVLDAAFGNGGTVASDPANSFGASRMLVQPDNKILLTGSKFVNGVFGLYVARLHPNGTFDTSFGNNGITRVTTFAFAGAIALQADGKIVLGGRAGGFKSEASYVIIRLNPDGSADTTFGNGGFALFNRYPGIHGGETIYDAAIQPDGKIVFAGTLSFLIGEVFRLNANGTPDTTFGDNGFVRVGAPQIDTFNGIAITTDGKILASGGDDSFPAGGVLFCFLQNGSLDPSFGQNGVVRFPGAAEKVRLQANGKIIVTGGSVRRFLPNGAPEAVSSAAKETSDIEFFPDGQFVTIGARGTQIYRHAADVRLVGKAALATPDIAALPDGKILALTNRTIGNDSYFQLVRYRSLTSLANRLSDLDDDEKSDISVYRPSTRAYYFIKSRDGIQTYIAQTPATAIFPEDYVGDFRSDLIWTTSVQSTNVFCGFFEINGNPDHCFPWGLAADVLLGGDYDGDTKSDFTVYRNGIWYVMQSSTQTLRAVYWGIASDKPVPADYGADGKTDTAVYRPSNGTWHVLRSSDNNFAINYFGAASDKPVPADYDGDGRADLAVYRPSSGFWYFLQTTDGFTGFQFGASEDKVVPADYDGDGKTDAAVWRPSNGYWYLRQSAHGFRAVQWGQNGDVPLSTTYSAN